MMSFQNRSPEIAASIRCIGWRTGGALCARFFGSATSRATGLVLQDSFRASKGRYP